MTAAEIGARPPARYRRVELTEHGPLLVDGVVPEAPSDDTVVLRPLVAGVCRSDLKEIQGARAVRHDFGHEFVARVLSAPARTGLRSSDVVVYNPHARVERTSGFGERVVASGDPAELAKAFPKVSAAVSARTLVACEPLACAARCVWNVRRRLDAVSLSGLTIGVVGAGYMGVLIAMLLRHYGAEIALLNRDASRLAFLRQREVFPASALIPMGDAAPRSYDAVVPTTSLLYPEVLRVTFDVVRPGGHVVLFGGTQAGTVVPDGGPAVDAVRREERSIAVNWNGTAVVVAGTYGATGANFEEAASCLASAPDTFPVERLISREIPLCELPAALLRLADPNSTVLGKSLVNIPEVHS